MAADRLLLADLPAGRIITTYNHSVQRSIARIFYHNLTQHHDDFAVYRDTLNSDQ